MRDFSLQTFTRFRGFNNVKPQDAAAVCAKASGPIEEEVEFVTVMWFSDLDAVRLFAGADYETAVVLPKARSLLSRFDGRSAHYETVCPSPGFQSER